MTALIVIAIIIAVFAILFTIPISCEFYFRYNNEIEQSFVLKYGFIRIGIPHLREKTKKTDIVKDSEPKEKDNKSAREVISFCRKNITAIKETIYAILGYMFKRAVKINMLRIKLVFGLEDAMETALIYGAVSAFIFNVLGVIDQNMRLGKHETAIKPAFNNPHIFAEVETKISTCIGSILTLGIIGAWHGVPLFIRYRKHTKVSDKRKEK